MESNQAQDRLARARDQLGACFMLSSNVFALGAVMAALDPRRQYMAEDFRWWICWALLLDLPALILVNAPWAMRAVFRAPERGAVRDTVRAMFPTACAVMALATIDVFVLQWGGLWDLPEILVAACVAPVVCTFIAHRRLGGSPLGLAALLPIVCYFNFLLMMWVGKYVVPVVVT